MIAYNPKAWFFVIFQFSKADTFRKLLPIMLVLSAYSALIVFIEIDYLKLDKSHNLSNISLMHSILGFVISLLLVFRTNTAYERWWEGRKLWGSLVNSSRNLALKMHAFLPADARQSRTYFSVMIGNYAFAMKNHLRRTYQAEELESHEEFAVNGVDPGKHVPNQIAGELWKKVNTLHRESHISGDQLIVLDEQLQSLTDIVGACERIRSTPIPYSYSTFLKKFIFFYVLTLPLGYAFNLHYLVIPVVVFIFYVLASLEIIAEEIEDPFGKDANDLPTDEISGNIRTQVKDILD